MTAPDFPNGQTVTVRRPAPRDNHGDPSGTPTDTPVAGCVVWPEASTEQTFQQDLVTLGYQVLMPPGTDVLATDQVLYGGTTFEVAGEPQQFTPPWPAVNPGVLVTIRRNR